MTFSAPSLSLAKELLATCEARGWHLATAESCTGGLIIGCLTEIAGSSNVVERGYVTYDNRAKQEVLGVPPELLASVGAVSEEVARAMAAGARERSGVDIAIAVTGIAGPGGATPTKPVGLVHMAVALREQRSLHAKEIFPGDRSGVRLAAVDAALELALRATRSRAP
jgi:nicotinamide-nucleotide amidase